MKLGQFFSNLQAGESRSQECKFYGKSLKISCLQLKTEQLFIASNVYIGNDALLAYKRRWGIEQTFKAIKSSGFNFEDTHITCHKKLAKLFAIASVALAICIIAGEIKNTILPIVSKNHGRKQFSLFTYGFDWLKELLNGTKNAVIGILSTLLHSRLFKAWN